MAFNPRTDVILEVANAADPSRASLAAERLAALAAGRAPPADFAASLDKAKTAVRSDAPAGLPGARARLAGAPRAADPSTRLKTEFEAMALGPFVNEILPKETSGLFGGGAAGDMWRSMLADEIARQVAKSGALGLSRRLFASHDLMSGRGQTALAAEPAAQTSANVLSAPSGANLSNGAILFLGRRA